MQRLTACSCDENQFTYFNAVTPLYLDVVSKCRVSLLQASVGSVQFNELITSL